MQVSLSSYSTLDEDEIPNDVVLSEKRHSFPRTQDSVDEEFHENLVYGGIFKKYSASQQSLEAVSRCKSKRLSEHGILALTTNNDQVSPREKDATDRRSGASSPDRRDLLPMTTLTVSRKASPFASSDSLATDQKADHSDGIWNESQVF